MSCPGRVPASPRPLPGQLPGDRLAGQAQDSVRGSQQLGRAQGAAGPPRPQSSPTSPAPLPLAPGSLRPPPPRPPAPSRPLPPQHRGPRPAVRGHPRPAGWQMSRGARTGAPGRPASPGHDCRAAASPPPAGPFGRCPAGPLTLHHLLRLLPARAALRRHVGCSFLSGICRLCGPQPIRAPSSEVSQPMGPCAPARLESLHGSCSSPARPRGPPPPRRQSPRPPGNGRTGGSGGGKRDEGRDDRGRKHGAEPAGERRGAWVALRSWTARDTAGRLPSPSEPRRRRLQNWADIVAVD